MDLSEFFFWKFVYYTYDESNKNNNFHIFAFLFSVYFGISVKTDLHTGKAVSRLYIANANRHDSGNYTCAIGDFAKVTVAVHVLNGKLSYIFSLFLIIVVAVIFVWFYIDT